MVPEIAAANCGAGIRHSLHACDFKLRTSAQPQRLTTSCCHEDHITLTIRFFRVYPQRPHHTTRHTRSRPTPLHKPQPNTMASHPSNDNPWQDETSPTHPRDNPYTGSGHPNPNTYSTYQDQPQSRNPYAQDSHHQGQYVPPDHPPPHQQPLSSNPPGRYYQGGAENEAGWGGEGGYQVPQPSQQSHAPGHASSPNYPSQNHATNPSSFSPSSEIPPSLPPRRSATDLALPTGQDRSHQIEVMQSYEAAGRKDEHDANVELLQREFPKIDGSLIAAIYGDSQSLSATREMLGELDG